LTEYEYEEILQKLRKEYCEKIEMLEKSIQDDNGEKLQVCRHRDTYQYLISTDGEKPKYVKSSDPRVAQLAQEKYNRHVIGLLQNKINAIDMFNKVINPIDLEESYTSLSAGRQQFITPVFLSEDMYSEQWQCQEYEKKPIYDEPSVQTTQNGEKVRSKSEVFIANQLLHFGIPYKYEKPLKIGSVTYHPDFTVINTRTRRQYYWEHLGMTDDPAYCDDAIKRLRTFASAGLLLGRDVIITAETQRVPLNTRVIDRVITEYLL